MSTSNNRKLNPVISVMLRNAAPIAYRQQNYPGSFSMTLEKILEECGISPSELAALVNVDRRTVYRILEDDEYQTTKQLVIGICVALKLPAQDAFALVEKAGFRLRMTSAQDAAYFSVLCSCGRFSMADINDVLVSKGLTPIGPKIREMK